MKNLLNKEEYDQSICMHQLIQVSEVQLCARGLQKYRKFIKAKRSEK